MHYVLTTQTNTVNSYLYLFDPYLDEDLKYADGMSNWQAIPYHFNRQVPFSFFEADDDKKVYVLEPKDHCEVIVLARATRKFSTD
ncbi:hypothetical protein [Sporolactobacillus pectinivorans]|uniref:hypothetical protein n=1 Tax=Sporolactobacillus pectinivorans TaxID=1591408 RepID=UPI001390006F|nr:hypothetical protein [Sporolactobacillus pectinivorans]